VPVSAPGKGATPEGKLCVSAVSSKCDVSVDAAYADGAVAEPGRSGQTSKPRMADELSWKAMIELSTTLGPLSVALTIWKRVCFCGTPSMTMVPPKYQCRECSELDWAMSKHSTSVGSRLSSETKSLV